MHIITGIEQRSPEWHALRKGRLTGTSIKTVMVGRLATKNKLLQSMRAEMDGAPLKPFYCSDDMQYGIEYEPMARARYDFEYDTELFTPAFVIHGKYKFIGVSPDGMNYDLMAEFKCLKKSTHHQHVLTGDQLNKYKAQLQAQMWVCEKPLAHFICFRHDYEDITKQLHVIEVKRDQVYIDEMESRCIEFHAHLMNGTFYTQPAAQVAGIPNFF